MLMSFSVHMCVLHEHMNMGVSLCMWACMHFLSQLGPPVLACRNQKRVFYVLPYHFPLISFEEGLSLNLGLMCTSELDAQTRPGNPTSSNQALVEISDLIQGSGIQTPVLMTVGQSFLTTEPDL